MQKILQDVRAFHDGCSIPTPDFATIPSHDRVSLRLRLIEEEFGELRESYADRDLVGIADALADLIYVAAGAALEFGIPLARVWEEVQRSNMAKIDPVTGFVNRREDGKILKPKGWTPPDVQGCLEQDDQPKTSGE